MRIIYDDVRAYVPAEFLAIFDNNSITTNPSVVSMPDYMTWSNESVCGLHCKHALKATVYMCGIFDPAHHRALWNACADNCLTICNG